MSCTIKNRAAIATTIFFFSVSEKMNMGMLIVIKKLRIKGINSELPNNLIKNAMNAGSAKG